MDYIISFKVPADRLSLFVDLLTGEGMQLSVKACLTDKAPIHSDRATPRFHSPGKHLPQIIFEAMESPKTYEQIAAIVTGAGFKETSTTPSISRLRAAGFLFKDERGRYSRVPNVIFDPKAVKQVKSQEI